MPLAVYIFVVLLFSVCNTVSAKEFAKPGEGIRPNQRIIRLEDGSFYAVEDQKRVPPNVVLTPKEQIENRLHVIQWLNQFRYWNDGVPPEDTAVERFLKKRQGKPVEEGEIKSPAPSG